MNREIKNRYTGSVIYSGDTDTLRELVEKAVREGKSLSHSNLSGSNLSGSNLRGSNLSGSDLSGSDLSRSNLRDSNLRRSNLRGSNLSGSNLSGSDLSGSNLRDSDLRVIKLDYWDALSKAPKEIAGLRKSLIEGKVNGSTYEGECACLVGTIANVAHRNYQSLPNLKPDSSRPIERFFLGISTGDTPETSQFSKLAVEWLDEWLDEFVTICKTVAESN